MNIFILNRNPRVAAKYHCDKHVVKMVLETAQILSTVAHHYGSNIPGLYKPTHPNHPCVVWAREPLNFAWLHRLGEYLCLEYTYRYGKTHASERVINSIKLPMDLVGAYITETANSYRNYEFVQAMPDQYKDPDPVTAYRNYYLGEKSHMLVWTRRAAPFWALERK